MACPECDRLSKVEIECTRRAEAAQYRLQSFAPEPPFGEAAANELHSFELISEQCRAAADAARRERQAHLGTHALTMSR